MRYAAGKAALGICDRCGLEFRLRELLADGYSKGLLVCAPCRDIAHPAEAPLRTDEGIVLKNPRPNREDDSTTLASGTAQAGGADTITLAASSTSLVSILIGQAVTLTAGTGSGQERTIADYNGVTKVARVSVAWTTPPDGTSHYQITPALVAAGLGQTFGGGT